MKPVVAEVSSCKCRKKSENSKSDFEAAKNNFKKSRTAPSEDLKLCPTPHV